MISMYNISFHFLIEDIIDMRGWYLNVLCFVKRNCVDNV